MVLPREAILSHIGWDVHRVRREVRFFFFPFFCCLSTGAQVGLRVSHSLQSAPGLYLRETSGGRDGQPPAYNMSLTRLAIRLPLLVLTDYGDHSEVFSSLALSNFLFPIPYSLFSAALH